MPTKEGAARTALIVMLAINLLNYVDRQMLAAVESRIEETFFPESEYPRDPETQQPLDPTIEGKIGSLNLAFMVSYILLSPVFGLLADRMRRWTLVGIGIILWSLATGGTGLAPTFMILFLTRCLVGVGESAYGPVAPSIIADLYSVEQRGRMLSLFYAAIPVGSALGYVLGGQITGWTGDWRWAFLVVVPPGLLLGGLCFFMPEPKRGRFDSAVVPGTRTGAANAGTVEIVATAEPQTIIVPGRGVRWRDYAVVLKTPSYVLATIGLTAMTFALGGMAFWMPRYISKVCQAGPLEEVNVWFGIVVVVSGLGGTILGGMLAEWAKPRVPGSYFLVSGVAMIVGFPMALLVLCSHFPLAWVFLFLACFCLFFNTGPINTILVNVTHPSVRASAFALNILIIHGLGDAISPAVIGLINGYSGSMTVGFLAVSFMYLVAAVCWLLGVRHLERDTRLAPTRL
jgi:MFS transporter, Spinster family, sphingosine-1-phosphate transporter